MGTLSQPPLEIFVGVSTGHFDPLIEACDRLSDSYQFFGQIGSGVYTPKYTYVRVLPLKTLKEIMNRADLVITHAGTGMLSLCYELKKKTIVVPKQRRYGEANDGQVELGRRWCDIGLGIFCLSVSELAECIPRALENETHHADFPSLGKRIKPLLVQP